MATTTAAQRDAAARREFDAYLASCPSRMLLDRIADKWVVLTLTALDEAGRPLRYSEISRTLAGVSQKMLTQTLRALERDGLVRREVTPSVPVRVDYELTPLGGSLLAPIRALKAWAESHMVEVEQARLAYEEA